MTKLCSLRSATLTCAFLAFLVPVVNGQDISKTPVSAEKRALIAELLEVTQSRKIATDIYRDMMEQQREITREVIRQSMEMKPEFTALSEQEQEKLRKEMLEDSDRTNQRVEELMQERIDYPALIEEISYQLYDKYYTEAELEDLVSFYRSAAGKKAIEVGPKLFAESMELARLAIQPKMRDVITILSKEESDRITREIETLKTEMEATKPPPAKRRSSRRRRP